MTDKCIDAPSAQFDLNTFLSMIRGARRLTGLPRKHAIFVQGDASHAVFYILRGAVELNVVSKAGKKATIAILNEGDFFGESCLIGQPLRQYSATVMTACTLLQIERKRMAEALHRRREFADVFVAYLLARNVCFVADLADQLLSSSEQRLARILLSLADFSHAKKTPAAASLRVSQETLAGMVGTTRSRVSFFLNRFRQLGLVAYHGQSGFQVHRALLSAVLNEVPAAPKSAPGRSSKNLG